MIQLACPFIGLQKLHPFRIFLRLAVARAILEPQAQIRIVGELAHRLTEGYPLYL
ncbi:hypothetical protein D3C73_1420680 [compost metagenome]